MLTLKDTYDTDGNICEKSLLNHIKSECRRCVKINGHDFCEPHCTGNILKIYLNNGGKIAKRNLKKRPDSDLHKDFVGDAEFKATKPWRSKVQRGY